MAFKGFTIGSKIVSDGSSGGVRRTEPGVYLVQIQSGKPSPEDYEKTEHIRWSLKILAGPENVGRTFIHRTYLTEESQFGIGDMLWATGNRKFAERLAAKEQTIEEYSEFEEFVELLLTKLKDKQFAAEIGDDNYQGEPSSKIFAVFPPSDYEQAVPASQDIEEVEAEIDEPDEEDEEDEEEDEEETPPPPKKATRGRAKAAAKPAAKGLAKTAAKGAAKAASYETKVKELFG